MEVIQFIVKLSKVLFLVLPELIAYLAAYYAVNAVYRTSDEKYNGENGILTRLVEYFHFNAQNMARDLTFLLGFYVSTVAKRWWDQVAYLPEPDNLAIFLNGVVIQDASQKVLNLKRKIIRCAQVFPPILRRATYLSLHIFSRYSLVSWILCLVRFSQRLYRRFPDMAALRSIGLLTDGEMTKLEHHYSSQLWMIPLNWAANLVRRFDSYMIYKIISISITIFFPEPKVKMSLETMPKKYGANW